VGIEGGKKMKTYYKGAKPNGWDFYTGETINYRENIGKTVKVPKFDKEPELCSDSVIHASRNPNDIFVGCSIPCSVFIVKGDAVIEDGQKAGFKKLAIVEEISQEQLESLFGWRYLESVNPINPLKIVPSQITSRQIELLRNWASVRDSVWASVRASVGASVRDSVWASVWDSVGASVRDSVWASVGASVGDSVGDSVGASVGASVWDSVGAYIGSLFPKIEKWKYIKHKKGKYPFQSCVDLWKMGLVPSFDRNVWRLHGGENASILWEGTLNND